MRTRWRVTAATAAMAMGLLAAAPRPALAQPRGPVSQATKDMARSNYRAGEAKMREGNYALALTYFTNAENILPVPATKYKIGLCHDRLGHAGEAVRWYKLFLQYNPPGKMAEAVADARGRLAVLEREPGRIQLIVTPFNAPGISVSVDGGPPQSVASMLTPPAGRHRLVIQGPGLNPAVVDVDVAVGETKQVSINLNAAGPVGPVGPGPVGGPVVVHQRSNVPAYALLGVAGATAILSGVFGGLALSAKSAFNSHPRGDTSDADREALDAKVSDAMLGVAIATGVTGIVLIATNQPHVIRQGSIRPWVTPYGGPTGAGLVGGLSF